MYLHACAYSLPYLSLSLSLYKIHMARNMIIPSASIRTLSGLALPGTMTYTHHLSRLVLRYRGYIVG